MRYLVIGLGIYGSNLAIDLANMGHEVIGADSNPSIVEGIKNSISTAYIVDTGDETALSMLPITNVDLVIVAIGENFGASIRTVALLKKAGVSHIYARAIDPLHYSILEGFHIDRIITPEQHAARDLVYQMALGSEVETLKVADDTMVMRFAAPAFFAGMRYAELNLRSEYHLTLICAARHDKSTNMIGMASSTVRPLDLEGDPELTVAPGDIWTVIGNPKAFRSLCRS